MSSTPAAERNRRGWGRGANPRRRSEPPETPACRIPRGGGSRPRFSTGVADPQRADIGERRQREPRRVDDCRVVVERACQERAGVGEVRRALRRRLRRRSGRLFMRNRHLLLRLPLDQLRLLVQIDEHGDLRPQHLEARRASRYNRQSRSRANSRGGKREVSSLKPVTKMIGVCSDFFRCRIRAAVSKPSISGMLTSSRIRAKVLVRAAGGSSPPAPRAHANDVLPQVVEDCLQRNELLGHVVDDQDIDSTVGFHGVVLRIRGLDSSGFANGFVSAVETLLTVPAKRQSRARLRRTSPSSGTARLAQHRA